MDFSELIAPVGPSEFVRRYWGRRVLHVAADSPVRRSIAALDEIDRVLNASGGNDLLTVASPSEGVRDVPGIRNRHRAVAPFRLYASLHQGRTLRYSYAERRLPGAAAAFRAIQDFVQQHPNDATVFVSPPGGAAFPPHFDDEHTFTVQLEGTKTWTIHRPARDGEATPVDARSAGPVRRRVILRPGQILYVPPRVIHAASASDAGSVSIGFGFRNWTTGDVFRRAAEALDGDLPCGWTGDKAGVRKALSGGLRRLKRALPEALEELHGETLRETPPLCAGALRSSVHPPAIGARTRLERPREIHGHVHRARGRTVLSFPGGGEIRTLPEAYAALAWIARSEGPFTLRDVPGPLGRADRLQVLRQLVAVGMLVVRA